MTTTEVNLLHFVKSRRRTSTFVTKRNIYKKDVNIEEKMKHKRHDREEFDHKIDIVLVGNKNVGKSSLLFQLGLGMFSIPYLPTRGVDFLKKSITTYDDQTVEVKFWDTCEYLKYDLMW